MFRDDQQRAAVCNAFLQHFGKPALFHASGPKPEALEYSRSGYPGSSKEADFFRLAWSLWSSESDIGFMDLVGGLDERSLTFLGEFVAALGRPSSELDAWVDRVPKRAWLGAL